MDIAALRTDLPVTNGAAYMDHAAVGPVPLSVVKAASDAMELQSQHPKMMNTALAATTAKARCLGAKLLGAAEDRLAFIGNTSHGLSMIANGLDWQDGDQIVVSDHEFPSNYLIWAAQAAKGATLVNWPMVGGRLTPETLAEMITARTRVVALSHVQYHNGFRADIAALAEITHRHDALLVVDGTQSIGAMPFDLDGWDADAIVFSAHKWMLCPKGIGLMALSARAMQRVNVTTIGWQSVNDRFAFRRELDFLPTAARFEPGTENLPGRFAIAERLAQIMRLGPNNLETAVLDRRDRVADVLRQNGWQVISPDGPARSGIVTAQHPTADPHEVVDRLEISGIRTSARGGGLRISPHFYNDGDDIARLAKTLKSA